MDRDFRPETEEEKQRYRQWMRDTKEPREISEQKMDEWIARISGKPYVTEKEVDDFIARISGKPIVPEREVDAFIARISGVHEAQWDSSLHPRAPEGQPDGGEWVKKGGGGGATSGSSTSTLGHSAAERDPKAVDQHSAPPEMLALAHAWHKTNNLLRQCRRDLEQFPARIATAEELTKTGGRFAYIHSQLLAKAKQEFETTQALVPQLEEQLRALEKEYADAGYDDVTYSTWTPGETLISGRGIEQVGRAVDAGGSPAGLKPTGFEFDIALSAGAVLQLGKLALGKALGKASRVIVKPSVTDPKLRSITQDLYKGVTTPKPLGSGSTADAIRNELRTGQATYGRFHKQKGQEYARALEKWLQKNPNASDADRAAAQQMLNDLLSALKGE